MAQPSSPNTDWRNQEIKIDPFVYQLAAGIFLIVIAILIGFALFPNDKGYLANIYTTLIGVLITVVYLDRRAERREALRAESELKARLIREMGSKSSDASFRAVEELQVYGWLQDGSLERALLIEAWLPRTNLMRAKLHDATLMGANLQGTVLFQADLNGVSLNVANLEQTNLVEADLQNAIFFNTRFDKLTLLPDGTFWSPETDLTRFTDSNHPQFWRSDDPSSPAYRGRLSSMP